MLAYVKGILEMKMTGYIVIDVGGLGYKIYMSDSGIEKLGNIDKHIYLIRKAISKAMTFWYTAFQIFCRFILHLCIDF